MVPEVSRSGNNKSIIFRFNKLLQVKHVKKEHVLPSPFSLFLRVEKNGVLVARPRVQHVQRFSELGCLSLVHRSLGRDVPEILRLQHLVQRAYEIWMAAQLMHESEKECIAGGGEGGGRRGVERISDQQFMSTPLPIFACNAQLPQVKPLHLKLRRNMWEELQQCYRRERWRCVAGQCRESPSTSKYGGVV